ncbi:MAG: replicative DNA helicase [bacterium]|nr:replicative DNA helicase [bacterium]
MTAANTDQRLPAGFDRLPPHDLAAEMATLGSMTLDRQAVEAVLPIINRDETHWFYRPDHRLLFELLVDVYDRGDPLDLVVVHDELQRRGQLDQVGGSDYLVTLAESVPTWVNAEYYAKIVRDKGLLRDLIQCTGQITEQAYAQGDQAAIILDAAEARLFGVTERRVSGQVSLLADVARPVYARLEERGGHYLSGLATGFTELDDLTSGLQAGDLIIVAGRPSMGKTALGLNMAENMAVREKDPIPVVFFSMEMSKEQLAMRILCSRGQVSSHKIRRGMLSEEDIATLGWVCGQLESAPLYIDDTPGMTALELRSKARRLARQHDIQAVFVDYLQLMHSPADSNSRQQEIAAISRALKGLGRELNVPVITMAQLNRASESREGNRPRMSDLRESGAIEQDADVVLLLHREEYYHIKAETISEEIKGVAEVIVAKQRNGPTDTLKLQFNRKLTRFNNLAVTAETGPLPEPMSGYEEPAPF